MRETIRLFHCHLEALLSRVLPVPPLSIVSAIEHVDCLTREWLDHPFFRKLVRGQLMGQYVEKAFI